MLTIWKQLADWIGELCDEIKKACAPVSFGITDEAGGIFFIEARKFTLDRNGRLLFWKGGRVIAVIEAGKWQRVLEGISLEDFKE